MSSEVKHQNTQDMCEKSEGSGSQPVGCDPFGNVYLQNYLHRDSQQQQNCSYKVAMKMLWLGTPQQEELYDRAAAFASLRTALQEVMKHVLQLDLINKHCSPNVLL